MAPSEAGFADLLAPPFNLLSGDTDVAALLGLGFNADASLFVAGAADLFSRVADAVAFFSAGEGLLTCDWAAGFCATGAAGCGTAAAAFFATGGGGCDC